MKYRLGYNSLAESKVIKLNGSKSISNRALIIQALCSTHFNIEELSTAKDTITLQNLLNNITDGATLDVGAGGTTFRFLTALLAMKSGSQILTGSIRMKQRPIGALVEALRSIGARIDYLENEGYPPLKIHEGRFNEVSTIRIPADVSSQYISALMLIAPNLPNGLEIHLEGDIVSLPYLLMTKSLMSYFGAEVSYQENKFSINPISYKAKKIKVEGDWSAASYFYSIVAFEKIGFEIKLKGLHKESVQGDRVIAEIAEHFGVQTSFERDSILIKKISDVKSLRFNYDFIFCPDLAQSVSVMMAGTGVEGNFSGLNTLRIKETDRILALEQELNKVAVLIDDMGQKGVMHQSGKVNLSNVPVFDTYEDHRMAMSLACLGIFEPVVINEPTVVEKSYPEFWSDLSSIGFKIDELA